MKGHPTTFLGLFDPPVEGRPAISAIEIPIIQRDFAQGRPDDETSGIRDRFVDAIVGAATTDETMALDFVYGDVNGDGVLRPLDGQQRLTTLFLLHWYVASRAGVLDPGAPWLRFSYATRPTARDFCSTIAEHPLPDSDVAPSVWITDQPWYVYPWRQDPTIASMLVMLDGIHDRFGPDRTDFAAVWSRLEQRVERAIWFLFLPVEDMAYGEDLYIKMNSRGKPLTAFEVFKADLEGMLKPVLSPEQYEHLATSIDGSWADLLWEYEKSDGADYVIDDEFMRYLWFIINICEWRDGDPDRRWRDKEAARSWPLEERARLSFAAAENTNAARNREFLFHAFDTWIGTQPSAEFERLFAANGRGHGPLPLFASASPDLFGACIAGYGSGNERDFSLSETIMLYAVLLARMEPRLLDADLNRRLRSLRNLAESAFIDRKRMPEYLATTERLILHGSLEKVQGFNAEWAADEKLKWTLMDQHPDLSADLHILEDLQVTRGRLFAFELDPATIAAHATTFRSVADLRARDALGAALLTKGDYSRDVGWEGTRRQFGNSQNHDSWRDLFTTGTRESVGRTRHLLMELLDDLHGRTTAGEVDPTAALEAICSEWLHERECQRHYDWRYYLVRYSGARCKWGPGYYHNTGYDEAHGFSYEQIRLLHGNNYSSYFSDALLQAAWVDGGLADVAAEPKWWRQDDGMKMTRSGLAIHVTNEGFRLVLPPDSPDTASALDAISALPRTEGHHVLVRQSSRMGRLVDVEDRVQICIRLVRALGDAGL